MNYRCHQDLAPLVEPMYYRYPKCNAAYEVPNQFFFGTELMVVPITRKSDAVAGLGSTEAFLPAGSWFDFFTGMHYAGGKGRKLTLCRDKNTIPVFARPGAIIPMAVLTPQDNRLENSRCMELLVFPGSSNRFTLLEDEGDGMAYQDGCVAKTEIRTEWGEDAILTIEPALGDLTLIPEERCWRIGLRGFHKDIRVCADGKAISCTRDAQTNTTWVEITAPVTEQIRLQISGKTLIHDNSDMLARCEERIQFSQCSIRTKGAMWDLIRDKKTTLLKKYLVLGGLYQDQYQLAKALQELLCLTEDPYLGNQL